MNKLICSLIVAIGCGTLPEASADTSSIAPATPAEASVSSHSPSAHRTVARKRHHRHHRHHRHRHHHHSKKK